MRIVLTKGVALAKKEVCMWVAKYMLRPVTHCKEGCSTLSWA